MYSAFQIVSCLKEKQNNSWFLHFFFRNWTVSKPLMPLSRKSCFFQKKSFSHLFVFICKKMQHDSLVLFTFDFLLILYFGIEIIKMSY